MDEKAQSSTVDSSEIIDNSPDSSHQHPKQAALEAAEYLRSLGLTVPYEDICQRCMFDQPRKLVSCPDDPPGLTSLDGLPDCFIQAIVSTEEQWNIGDKSLSLLRDVCETSSEAEIQRYIDQIKERVEATRVRQLKVELPALRSDNETDMRRYTRRIWAAREVHLSDHHLPLEPCDEEKDEGLEFPSKAYIADRTIVESVENEKFEISKGPFQRLLSYLKADWTEEDQQALLMSQVEYRGLVQRQPITPPLSPEPEPGDAFVPDEETCEIPLPSDPSSRISDDLRTAEDHIFGGEDDSGPTDSDLEQFVDFEHTDGVDMVLSARPIQKRDDLKVEEPLLTAGEPEYAHLSPGFGAIRDSIPEDHSDPGNFVTEEIETGLHETMKEIAAKIMMGIEQEKLEPLDATIRVNLPVMDFRVTEPEWARFHGDAAAIFRHIPEQSGVSLKGSRWSRKLIEESKMTWKIWTSRDPKPAIEEPIEDTALLDAFLDRQDGECVPTSLELIMKEPGLAILREACDEDEDEEEIQPFCVPTPAPQGDWMTLIKKRKLFLDDAKPATGPEREHQAHDKSPSSDRTIGASRSILLHEEEGAAEKLLDNYLELHAPKKMRLGQSPFFKNRHSPAKAPGATENSDRIPPQTKEAAVELQSVVPCPKITQLDKPLKLVVAVNIPRGMIPCLGRLLPGVEMIDRDYNSHNAPIWIPGAVCRSEVASAIAHEADIIASPSTGIIVTTMVQVRQKPLPGTKENSPLSSRVEHVAAKYERLVILMSENKLDESSHGLSASDAAEFAEFQAFAGTLPSETMVLFVGGSKETLAKWVAAIATRYAAGAQHLQEFLVQDETHWELFLRRAGMNVYAAQVVLGMLRAPDGEPSISHERAYGLPAFIKMAEDQRYAMFEAVLGGRRVLTRVGRILDATWGGVARRHG